MMALIYILDKFFNRTLSLDAPKVTDDSGSNGHNTFGLEGWQYMIVLEAIGFFAGIMVCRLILITICFVRQKGKASCGFVLSTVLIAMFCPWNTKVIEVMAMNMSLTDEDWDGRFSLYHQD